MSIFRWRGNGAGTKTDMNDGRNWIDEAGTAYGQTRYPGSESGTEDDVFFDAAVTNGCTTKTDHSNATDYASGAEILRSVRVSAAYDNALGASGKYFKTKCREMVFEGTNCTAAYVAGWTTGYSAGIGKLTVTDAVALSLDGTISNPVFLKGVITCAADTTVIATSLTIGYVTSQTTDVTLTLRSGMTLPSTVNVSGGAISNSNAVTTLNIAGGAWTQSSGALTTLTVSSGTVYWDDGNITTLYLYGGDVDASGGAAPRRIGTAYVYPSGTLNINNGQDNILVTTYVQNYGGTTIFSEGYTEAPYATTTYAGASDAKQGISPQIVNNTNVDSDIVYCGVQDRLDIYCTTGAIAAGGSLTFRAKEAATSGGSYSNISGKSVTFDDGDDNQTKIISIWGHELTAGKPFVKVNVANSAAADASVCAVIIKNVF